MSRRVLIYVKYKPRTQIEKKLSSSASNVGTVENIISRFFLLVKTPLRCRRLPHPHHLLVQKRRPHRQGLPTPTVLALPTQTAAADPPHPPAHPNRRGQLHMRGRQRVRLHRAQRHGRGPAVHRARAQIGE